MSLSPNQGVKMTEEKPKFIPCHCSEPLRVIHIEDKPYVHPEDLEHLLVCDGIDPKDLLQNQRDIESIENFI
jgi:hypothetical protein